MGHGAKRLANPHQALAKYAKPNCNPVSLARRVVDQRRSVRRLLLQEPAGVDRIVQVDGVLGGGRSEGPIPAAGVVRADAPVTNTRTLRATQHSPCQSLQSVRTRELVARSHQSEAGRNRPPVADAGVSFIDGGDSVRWLPLLSEGNSRGRARVSWRTATARGWCATGHSGAGDGEVPSPAPIAADSGVCGKTATPLLKRRLRLPP